MSSGKYQKYEEDLRKRSSLTRGAENTKISTTFGQDEKKSTERSQMENKTDMWNPSDSSGTYRLINFTGVKYQEMTVGEDFRQKDQSNVSFETFTKVNNRSAVNSQYSSKMSNFK